MRDSEINKSKSLDLEKKCRLKSSELIHFSRIFIILLISYCLESYF